MLPLSAASSPASSPACLLPMPENPFPLSFRQLREQIAAVSGTPLDLAGSNHDGGVYERLSAAAVRLAELAASAEVRDSIPVAPIALTLNDAAEDAHEVAVDSWEEDAAQPATAADAAAVATESISFVRHVLPAMLGGALRIGLATAAGRTATWAAREMLPSDLGAAAMPLAVAGSMLRGAAATGLCAAAAQSIPSARPRMAARAAAALCGGLMLLPAVAAYAAPSSGLACATALRGIGDVAYVLVRDPLQNCLRGSGPRMSLTRSEADPSPHWPALSATGVLYGLSAAAWMFLFEHHVLPGGCAAGAISPAAACNAVDMIAPAAAIEATEAAFAAAVFSLFSGARHQQDFSLAAPQAQVIAITAAMRLFATGILQLAELAMRTFFHAPGGLPFGICFLVMMSLEWVGGLAQQALAHVFLRSDADVEHAGRRATRTETTRL